MISTTERQESTSSRGVYYFILAALDDDDDYYFRNDIDDDIIGSEEHETELEPPATVETESMEKDAAIANHPGLSKAIEQFESEVATRSIDIPRKSKSADLRR